MFGLDEALAAVVVGVMTTATDAVAVPAATDDPCRLNDDICR